MSHRIGKNNARNRANRKKSEPVTPLSANVTEGQIVKARDGVQYRVGKYGELLRMG